MIDEIDPFVLKTYLANRKHLTIIELALVYIFSQYKDLIETISKVEYKKFANLGLIELSEVINLANYTVYYLINNSSNRIVQKCVLEKSRTPFLFYFISFLSLL